MAHQTFWKSTDTRARLKGRKARAEAAVKKAVRAACVERDGYCLVATCVGPAACSGRSTWAHLSGARRSHTRGMAPERRHCTASTAMLCDFHHALEERGLYLVVYHSAAGADGPVSWQRRTQKAAA